MSDTRWWSKRDDARLAVLWAEGHAASVIGREMSRTKNGIIGRSHRLHLPPRPSPLPGHIPALPEPTAPAPLPPPVVVTPVPQPAPPRMPTVRSCQYPHGDPGEPGFHYCGNPVWRGVYCRACHAVCYGPRRDLAA